MKRKTLERRTVLKGGAAAFGMIGSGASAATIAAARRLRARRHSRRYRSRSSPRLNVFARPFLANFDPDYVENAVIPFFLTSFTKASGRCCR